MLRFWKHIMIWFVFSALWGVFVFYLFDSSQNEHAKNMFNQALTEAKIAWGRDMHSRRWAASMGGLYAKVTDTFGPNPYLKVEKRDVTTTDGDRLTLINPAYMARMIHESMTVEADRLAHITSLHPIRPENIPDEWEAHVLKQFKTGKDEVYERTDLNGEPVLRYMRAIVTEERCLKCHADQGYKVGDLRGGMSVTVPFGKYEKTVQSLSKSDGMRYVIIWGIGELFLCLALIMLLFHEGGETVP